MLNGRRIEHRYERTTGSPSDWQRVVVEQTTLDEQAIKFLFESPGEIYSERLLP